jgi:flagellar FliJ protein
MLVKNPRGTLKRLKQFRADHLRRNIVQMGSIIAELDRASAGLEQQVRHLERSTGKTDLADAAYPVLAKVLIERRANVKLSAIELERQLDETKQVLSETLRELEEIEMAEQKHLQLSHSA